MPATARPRERRPTSVASVVAFILGVAAVAAFSIPLAPIVLGAVAIVAALRGRPELLADPRMRGAGFGGTGCLLGVAGIIVGLVPFVRAALLASAG